MIHFLQGMIIGVVMAVPVGPLAILCIRRSLKSPREGLATALGVALVDGFYSLIAALGLSTINTFVYSKKDYFYLSGGFLLIALGFRALQTPPSLEPAQLKQKGFTSTFLQTLMLTLPNPVTILTFIAAFAAFGLEEQQSTYPALVIALGVFSGSLIWFLSLSLLVTQGKKRLSPYVLWLINTLSGSLLIVSGLFFCGTAFKDILLSLYCL